MLYFGPIQYATSPPVYSDIPLRQVERTRPVSPTAGNTLRYQTDVDMARAVDPLLKDEPGSLVDIYV